MAEGHQQNELTTEQLRSVIREELRPINENLETLNKIVRGNGDPKKGLAQRLSLTEQHLDQMEQIRKERREDDHAAQNRSLRWALGIVTAIATLVATGLQAGFQMIFGR